MNVLSNCLNFFDFFLHSCVCIQSITESIIKMKLTLPEICCGNVFVGDIKYKNMGIERHRERERWLLRVILRELQSDKWYQSLTK